MYCICCKKDVVKPYSYDDKYKDLSEEDMLWLLDRTEKNYTTVDNMGANNGIIKRMQAGFGSGYDTDTFIIAICDDCIKSEIENGYLLYWGSQISVNSERSKELRNKSKQLLRRNSNLDKLI